MLKINYFLYSHFLNYLFHDNQIIELFQDIFEKKKMTWKMFWFRIHISNFQVNEYFYLTTAFNK